MKFTVSCLLTLVLLMDVSISYQIGHDKKVKMNVMLNTMEDGLVRASLYITNATSTMLNNASFVVNLETLLDENNTVIGAEGYVRDSRVNGSVNFSSIDEMENVQKLNRCQSSKEKEVKELQLADEEITKKLAFLEAAIQKFSIFNSKVEEEVRQLQLANDEMRRNLSSQAEENQKLKSSKSKVEEEVRELQLAIEEMKRNMSSQADEKQRSFTSKVSLLEKRGYEYIEGLGYYKYHSEGADFQNAVRICESEGSHLGVIDSEKEAEEFTKLMSKTGYWSIWVGIHDPHKRRSFQSIFGTPFNALGYSKWHSGQPNNLNGNEYCVYFQAGSGLGDYYCHWKLPFICEIDI